MKKLTLAIFVVGSTLAFAGSADAQMMGGFSNSSVDWDEVVEHTLREEQEGKELWERFLAEEIRCADFSDEQFGILGEYFMGTMMGESHAAMNAMMIQAHGEEGEEQIHIVMGKRLSGCDTSAVASGITGITGGWMPMMNAWSMMGFGYHLGFFGWIFIILWWGLAIVGIVTVIKWIGKKK